MKWFVYVAKCSDDSLYIGITTDPKRREWEHNNSKEGAKSVKGKRPVKIVYTEEYDSKATASKREYAIKNWKRDNKLKLISRS